MGLFSRLKDFLDPEPNDDPFRRRRPIYQHVAETRDWLAASRMADLHRAMREGDGRVPTSLLDELGVRTVETDSGPTAFITTSAEGGRHVEVGFPKLIGMHDLGFDEDTLDVETVVEADPDGGETTTTIGRDENGTEVFRRTVRRHSTSSVDGFDIGTGDDIDDVIRHVVEDLRGAHTLQSSPVADALAAFLDRHPGAKVVDDHIEIDLADDDSEEAIVDEMAEAVRLVEPPPAPTVPDEPPAPPPAPADLDLTEAGVLGVVFDTAVGAYERSTTVAERYLGRTVSWDAVVERTSTLGGRTEIHALLGHLTEAERYSDRVRATIRTDEVVDLDRDATVRFTAEIDEIDVYTRRITLVNARFG